MKIDKNKLARQEQGVERWRLSKDYGSHANGCGTLWYVTGFGKTFTALKLIAQKLLEKDTTASIVVLVHRDALKKQWNDRIKKFIEPDVRDNIIVQTAQYYIKNNIVPKCTLLIVDEVHKFYEDTFFSYVNGTNIKYKYILCLTATFKDAKQRHKKMQSVAPIVDQITEKEAIDNNWVSKYVEFNLGIDLSNIEVIKYNAITDKITKNLAKFGDYGFKGCTKVLQGCDKYTGFQYAMMWANQNGWDKSKECQWNPYKIIGYAKNAMKGIRERKELMYESSTKLDVVEQLINKFKEYKIMSFSESTKFANALAKRLNTENEDSCVCYHSQIPSKGMKDEDGNIITYKSGKKAGEPKIFGIKTLKKIYTDQFVNNVVRVLSTARALDEGFDCEDIQLGIISSRSSNYNQYTQRGGRIKRIIPSKPDAKMLIINVYFRNTKDHDWLKKSQSKSTHKVNYTTDIEDIDFEDITNSFEL